MGARLSVTPHTVVLGHDGAPRYAGYCPQCLWNGTSHVVTAQGPERNTICHHCGAELQFRVSGVVRRPG